MTSRTCGATALLLTFLLLSTAMLLAVTPASARSGCLNLGQGERPRPLADPIPYFPVNGTAGFFVHGANTLPGQKLSAGLGYVGQDAVCQQEEGIFDQNSLFLALGYGITDRIQIGLQVPYTWYEADKAGVDGSGIDDINFGASYRLLDEGAIWPGVAVYGYASAPTAEREEFLGTNEWGFGTGFAFSKTLVGNLVGFATVGYIYNGRGAIDVDDQFTSGLGVEYAINKHVSVVAEGIANTNWRSGADKHSDWIAALHGGFRFRFGPGFLLSVAGRKGLTNDAPDWGAFALLTYEHSFARPVAAAVPEPAPPAAPPAPPVAPTPPVPPAAPPVPAPPAEPTPAVPGPPAAPVEPAPPAVPPPVAVVPPAALPPPLRSALRDIHYEFDRYEITEEAKRTLEDLAQALKANRDFSVLIEGHADERGTAEYNLALGARRAQAAKDYLVSLGVEASRIDTISYGRERPLDPGHDELAWALNRRAHFVVRVRP
jgi:peptidoglycan-associated lipoprotein